MKRRDFLKNTGALLAASPFMNVGSGSTSENKMMILGFDGMDPGIILTMVKRGELPNIRKFVHMGSFRKMISTAPPESPCAWSSFATGKDPGCCRIHRAGQSLTRYLEPIFPVLT